jgi:DnaJ-class molecular chaperone
MGKDYYQTLGLPPSATQPDIAAKFRLLALMHHPEKNPSVMAHANYKFAEVCEAYEVLSNRKQYY